MATVMAFRNVIYGLSVPPRGVYYFVFGPDNRLGSGAITVTAHASRGVSGTAPDFVEMVQTATRLENPSAGRRLFLDLVVRNNNQSGWKDAYTVYTSVIAP